MALTNAERQRRFRERRRIEAAKASPASADVAAVYEVLRREWLLSPDHDCGPAERAYLDQLAAMPASHRSPGERLERIEELFSDLVGNVLARSYQNQFHGKRRIDRRQAREATAAEGEFCDPIKGKPVELAEPFSNGE